MNLITMYSSLKDPKTTIVCTVMPVREFDVEVYKLKAKLRKRQIKQKELDKAIATLHDEAGLKRINKDATTKRIAALVKAGMKIARINFSHVRDDVERSNTEQLMKIIRQVSQTMRGSNKAGKPVGIMMDLCGPRARIGYLKQPRIVNDGEEFTLTTCKSSIGQEIPINKDTYIRLDDDIRPGEPLLIDDGRIRCMIKKI